MKKAFNFLKQHKEVAFATIDENGNPAMRVFQIMLIDETEKTLYFATSPKKEVYQQIQHNPNIEILTFADNISVRVSGAVSFEVSDTICKRIYEETLSKILCKCIKEGLTIFIVEPFLQI
jgi:uncharacterized pyridoxamine 5'-phosphate oxidase family protein